jgi:pSer/pThr/pTyr-binding forkhead associated (FHA) protein
MPAMVWFNLRFGVKQSVLSVAEIQVALAYVALCGWMLPLGVTTSYCLFTLPRTSTTTSVPVPGQKRGARAQAVPRLQPPRYQPGMLIPFVFGEDTPWGWLEYRGGNFQGQRLALKRAIITIGRDEDNDIWLDDDMASRHHAELAWDQGQVYLTDAESLNGVLLNGKRVRGTALVEANDLFEVGSHHFVFIRAEQKEAVADQHDPLANHTWRSAVDALGEQSELLPAVQETGMLALGGTQGRLMNSDLQETANIDHLPAQVLERGGALTIRDGEMMGKAFLLDRAVVTVGRGFESDIILSDASLSRVHVQFLLQMDGDYIQDLGSRSGTWVNDEVLRSPRRLQYGDIVRVGNIHLEYISRQQGLATPLPLIITPQPLAHSVSSPMLLRLPSRQKEQ